MNGLRSRSRRANDDVDAGSDRLRDGSPTEPIEERHPPRPAISTAAVCYTGAAMTRQPHSSRSVCKARSTIGTVVNDESQTASGVDWCSVPVQEFLRLLCFIDWGAASRRAGVNSEPEPTIEWTSTGWSRRGASAARI